MNQDPLSLRYMLFSFVCQKQRKKTEPSKNQNYNYKPYMRSANSIKLTPVAQIVKTYDSTGEVLIRINAPEFQERLENIKIKEPVFIHFEELPVPFFITSAVRRSGNAWIIKFSTVRDGAHGSFARIRRGRGSGFYLAASSLISFWLF